MKKLLKSILIATASIGTIAGATAAVVSCGTTPDKPAPTLATQANYDSAFHKIFTHFKTNSIFTVLQSDMAGPTGLAKITAQIQTNIVAFAGSQGALTAAELSSINIANQSAITFTPPQTFPTFTPGTPATSTGFQIMIPAAKGLAAKTTDSTMPIQFLVNANPVVDNYASAMTQIMTHFSSDSTPILTISTTDITNETTLLGALETSILTYINHTPGTGYLTQAERDAFKSGQLTTDDIVAGVKVSSGALDKTAGTHTTVAGTCFTLSVATPTNPFPQGTATDLIGVKYTVTQAPVVDNYAAAMTQIMTHFSSDSTPILTISTTDITNETTLTNALETSILTYINHTPGTGYLTQAERDAFKSGQLTTDDIVAGVKVSSGALDKTAGTHTTVAGTCFTLSVATPTNPFPQGTVTDLIGVKYTVTEPAVDNYEAAMTQIMTHFGADLTPIATISLTDSATQETLLTAVKTNLVNYINAPTGTAGNLTAAERGAFKETLTANDITLTVKGTLPGGIGIHPTDTNNCFILSVATSASSNPQGTATELVGVKYKIESDYAAAMTQIIKHFSTNTTPIINLSVDDMTKLTTLLDAVETNILAYINQTPGTAGALTASERAAFKAATLDATDIVAGVKGKLDQTVGTHTTDADNCFTLIVKTSGSGNPDGSTADLVGVKYNVVANYYDGAMQHIINHFSKDSTPIITLSAADSANAAAVKTALEESLITYISGTPDEGDNLTTAERGAFKAGTLTDADLVAELHGTLDATPGTHTTVAGTYFTFSIKGTDGTEGATVNLIGVKYTINA